MLATAATASWPVPAGAGWWSIRCSDGSVPRTTHFVRSGRWSSDRSTCSSGLSRPTAAAPVGEETADGLGVAELAAEDQVDGLLQRHTHDLDVFLGVKVRRARAQTGRDEDVDQLGCKTRRGVE